MRWYEIYEEIFVTEDTKNENMLKETRNKKPSKKFKPEGESLSFNFENIIFK